MNQHLELWQDPCSTQARELISGPDLATGARLLSFNRTQTRAVIGLLTGHNTMGRHLHAKGFSDNPLQEVWHRGGNLGTHSVRVWVLSFWTRRTLGCLGWGPSGTLSKEQSFYNLVKNRGHKGPVLRSRCIGPGEGPNPNCYSIPFYSCLFVRSLKFGPKPFQPFDPNFILQTGGSNECQISNTNFLFLLDAHLISRKFPAYRKPPVAHPASSANIP